MDTQTKREILYAPLSEELTKDGIDYTIEGLKAFIDQLSDEWVHKLIQTKTKEEWLALSTEDRDKFKIVAIR